MSGGGNAAKTHDVCMLLTAKDTCIAGYDHRYAAPLADPYMLLTHDPGGDEGPEFVDPRSAYRQAPGAALVRASPTMAPL